MISIDREKGYIIISRCDYLYRDGLNKRDEKAAREMGDGDILIPLPPHMVDTTHDSNGRTDGQNAVTIIEEVQRRMKRAARPSKRKVMAVLDAVFAEGGYKITVRSYNKILTGLGYKLSR